jgi:intracellular sulfur oxidation DsrE/DsrF family protein
MDSMDKKDTPGLTRRNALRGLGLTLAAAAGANVIAPQSASAQEATPPPEVTPDFKVVLHASEEQHWPYILSNLKNLTQDWPRARLRVVSDGSSVLNLQGENNLTNELSELIARGIELIVCPVALKEHDIDPTTIPAAADTSLGGVVALVVANQEGFVYVKP